jgi:hypothetical protein
MVMAMSTDNPEGLRNLVGTAIAGPVAGVDDLPNPTGNAGKLAVVQTGLGGRAYIAEPGVGWMAIAQFRPKPDHHVYLTQWGQALLGDFVPDLWVADEDQVTSVHWRNGLVTIDCEWSFARETAGWDGIIQIGGQVIDRLASRQTTLYDNTTGDQIGIARLSRIDNDSHGIGVRITRPGTASFGFTVAGGLNPQQPPTN